MSKTAKPASGSEPTGLHPHTWTFLTNHSHVLICLARDPAMRLRDVAEQVGITERAVQSIVSDLEEAGVITRTREGRRNRYTVHGDEPLRHPVESHCNVRDLLGMVSSS
jgi:predicted transcriptional regulator